MTWEETKRQFPERWLLIEAVVAHSENDQRIVDQLTVLGTFDDSDQALDRYLSLHKVEPLRELYVAHTSRYKLDIKERHWLGVRAASLSVPFHP